MPQMIRIEPDPGDDLVFDNLVDTTHERARISPWTGGKFILRRRIIGEQHDHMIADKCHSVADGIGGAGPTHYQRDPHIAVRREYGADIDEILLFVFTKPVVGTLGVDCPLCRVHDSDGGAPRLLAVVRAFNIKPVADTDRSNNQKGQTYFYDLTRKPSSVLKYLNKKVPNEAK